MHKGVLGCLPRKKEKLLLPQPDAQPAQPLAEHLVSKDSHDVRLNLNMSPVRRCIEPPSPGGVSPKTARRLDNDKENWGESKKVKLEKKEAAKLRKAE